MKAVESYKQINKDGPRADQSSNVRKIPSSKRFFAWYASRVFSDGLHILNERACRFFRHNQNATILDLGTGDTKLYRYFYNKIGSKKLFALDSLENDNEDVDTVIGDLEGKFPFPDEMFDVIISSQNIEHIIDTPQYINEIHRVLKPGGYVIVLTENISSWVNITALIFGWMPFSATNMFGIPYGNPFIWHSDIHTEDDYANFYEKRQWGCIGHQRLFTLRGLSDLFSRYGFNVKVKFGGGYFIFISMLAKIMSKIDKTHAHFIGIKAYKIKK